MAKKDLNVLIGAIEKLRTKTLSIEEAEESLEQTIAEISDAQKIPRMVTDAELPKAERLKVEAKQFVTNLAIQIADLQIEEKRVAREKEADQLMDR